MDQHRDVNSPDRDGKDDGVKLLKRPSSNYKGLNV